MRGNEKETNVVVGDRVTIDIRAARVAVVATKDKDRITVIGTEGDSVTPGLDGLRGVRINSDTGCKMFRQISVNDLEERLPEKSLL